jgi:hypothetical protein
MQLVPLDRVTPDIEGAPPTEGHVPKDKGHATSKGIRLYLLDLHRRYEAGLINLSVLCCGFVNWRSWHVAGRPLCSTE